MLEPLEFELLAMEQDAIDEQRPEAAAVAAGFLAALQGKTANMFDVALDAGCTEGQQLGAAMYLALQCYADSADEEHELHGLRQRVELLTCESWAAFGLDNLVFRPASI